MADTDTLNAATWIDDKNAESIFNIEYSNSALLNFDIQISSIWRTLFFC